MELTELTAIEIRANDESDDDSSVRKMPNEMAAVHQISLFDCLLFMNEYETDQINQTMPAGLEMTEDQRRQYEIFEDEERLYPEARDNDPVYMNLAAAIVLNAVKDAKGKNPDLRREALFWLQSDAAKLFYSVLGFSEDCFEKWRDNGMPTRYAEAERAYSGARKQTQ